MPHRVRLIEVQGDQIEFADLIGTYGELKLTPDSSHAEDNVFTPDFTLALAMEKKTVSQLNGKTTVTTRLGNTFVFEEQSDG